MNSTPAHLRSRPGGSHTRGLVVACGCLMVAHGQGDTGFSPLGPSYQLRVVSLAAGPPPPRWSAALHCYDLPRDWDLSKHGRADVQSAWTCPSSNKDLDCHLGLGQVLFWFTGDWGPPNCQSGYACTCRHGCTEICPSDFVACRSTSLPRRQAPRNVPCTVVGATALFGNRRSPKRQADRAHG